MNIDTGDWLMRFLKMTLFIAVAGCFSASAFAQNLPEWVREMKISVDIGIRTEFITDEKNISTDAHYDRLRERGRFRLGVETTPVEKVKVGFGIETSGTNPTSAWVNFNNFENASLVLSHAYIQYSPSDKLTISGGKLKNDIPLWKPVQLVWKNDVNPVGVAANIRTNVMDQMSFFANAAIFPLTADRRMYNNLPASDVPMHTIAIVQPGLEYEINDNIRLKGAFAVQQFSMSDRPASSWIMSNYQSFTLLNPAWEVNFANLVSKYGITVNGEYSANIHESADSDTKAYLIQAGFGSAGISASKDWQVKAAYRHLEDFAIPRGFGQTSAYDAEPGKGWELFFGYGLVKGLAFNATFYIMTDIEGNRPQNVSQLDVIYKF